MSRRPSRFFHNHLSRRAFLKLSGLGLAGVAIPPLVEFGDLNPNQQGRVIEDSLIIYDIPSFSGRKIKYYWKDNILPITNVTVGDEEPPFNRIWYTIGNEGYVHSGNVQPVRTNLNQPVTDIPEEGMLAEVTVPFTDARWGAGRESEAVYRYYYAATHWVLGWTPDAHGEPWYRVFDDKWDYQYYVQAAHLRIIPPDELSLLSPHVPPSEKRIEVRLNEQTLIAYEWERPVFMTRIASGAKFSTGDYSTPPGRYMTFHKRPSRHMARGNLTANGYDLPGVPWVIYFTEEGLAIHGTYWHNNYGRPRSHGCINLTPTASKWVYRWTVPIVPAGQQKVYENYGTILDVV